MGKGVIVEHLGDAHYRIGLDIDVSYARDQLAAIDLYLAEFAQKYQEATDAKNDAQAALAPINTRLTEYLADAQAASQAAYDAMVAVYDVWVDAVASQPDPGVLEPLREAMDYWFDGFATTHNDYILALDGDPQAELPVPDALESRTHALQQLTLAMGDWLGAVGALIDPAAVNDAFDALGIALDDFESATVAYVAAPGNPTLKSAMNYYQGVYESAHSDWVKAVDDNSGDEYVKAARDAYDAAAETFDNARAALGKLLDNGGMPPELADIMAEQERAYATYRGALQNWQSMTLIKTEKETAKAELMSRLLPFTNNDGEPVRQSVNAWCCDATEDIAVGAEVATIEIPSERDLGVRVRPAYESRETYSAARDGKLQPSWSSSPEATYWNWALHPGNARWNPNYRLGEILFIDPLTDKCTVQLDPQRNNEKSRARDGRTLDVINPLKYQIDPDTGEQTPILPGDNVQVADGVTTLTDVPIEYMECNAAVFEVGDHVMVEFQNRDWKQPKVIGFAENPRPCNIHGLILYGFIDGSQDWLFLKDSIPSNAKLTPPEGPDYIFGGNIDWVSTDKRTVITWNGPRGRCLSQNVRPGYGPYDIDTISDHGDNGYWLQYIRMLFGAERPQGSVSDNAIFIRATNYGRAIYINGTLAKESPASHYVIGASQVVYNGPDDTGNTVTKKYLVAVFGQSFKLDWADHEELWQCWDIISRPETVHHTFAWAEIVGKTVGDWNTFHVEELGTDPYIMPPTHAYFFSGSGRKFATLVPTLDEKTDDQGVTTYAVGNSCIVRGELSVNAEGVAIANISVTQQGNNLATYYIDTSNVVDISPLSPGWVGNAAFTRSDIINHNSNATVAIDFIGEQEVTLTANYSSSSTSSSSKTDEMDVTDGDYSASGSESGGTTSSMSLSIYDEHRAVEVGSLSYSENSTFSREYDYADGGGTFGAMLSASWIGSKKEPIYYDLRYGNAVWIEASGTRNEYQTLAGTLSDEPNASSVYTSRSANITQTITDKSGTSYVPAVDTYTFSEDRPYTGNPPAGLPIDEQHISESSSTGGSQAMESVCQKSSVPYLADSSTFNYVIPQTWAQPASNSGGGVYRVTFSCKPSIAVMVQTPAGPMKQFVQSFADTFDLNAVFQAHIEQYHPTYEGSTDATTAGVIPMHRK